MIDHNPFKTTGIAESDEMKALFKELREINARICFQYAEEKGIEFNVDTVLRNINALTEFDIVMFRMFAYTALANQPENTLPIDERIIIAANEAYNKVIEIG
ncbi:hypothetical protein CPT_Merlin87 [Citrobacter phage Merlin]|uniref:Uncharacterized protein n=1 Tax=Citrobacter phage Merlin TaxID=1675602 RepID=A0A0K1LNG3_9CAUD|nr:hypothetical protein CPT_Merlin87 [Citrobacter phage Merlin]AKU43733.1 hypothetical protein CPT_Merlin87 [Citrobacter phage Merlin]